jgi:hypothetical protein
VGIATGRDPFAEAVRFGVLGAAAGLGATRYQLAAGGILGAAVGGTTARQYGVEKGIEAGAAVFPLPLVLPGRLARGVFAGFAAERRPRAGLLLEPRVGKPRVEQPRVELPTMQDVRMYALLTRRTFSDVVADMARQATPDARRGLFEDVVQMALDRIRAGYDRDAVAAVLRGVRSKLDPALRREFDEVLRRYGLSEVKHRAPEYALHDEVAPALVRLFRRVPEYQLTDEAAAALGRFFEPMPHRIQLMPLSDPGARRIQLMMRSEPELRSYMLLRTRSEPTYALPSQLFRVQEAALAYMSPIAARQDQVYVTVPAAAQATAQRTAQRLAVAPLQTAATTPREAATTPLEQPTRTPPPGTPPATPPHMPLWMLNMPVSTALPLLAQMAPWLRLPPPPNPHMPLWAYLKMLRFPALGRQREVFVLI